MYLRMERPFDDYQRLFKARFCGQNVLLNVPNAISYLTGGNLRIELPLLSHASFAKVDKKTSE